MFKGIFFDWDGTLVDSLPLLYGAHNHVRGHLGVPLWTREEYFAAVVYSTRELYPRIYGDRAAEAQDILYSYIKENHLEGLSLLDGSEDLVRTLHDLGIPMGVVSNKRNDVLRREVEHLGWGQYFGVYNGAGVAALDKPSGVPLVHALAQHPEKLAIKDILYVGDTESDLSCAREAGCKVAYIQHPPGRPDLIEKYKPDIVVAKLDELKKILIESLAA